MYKSKNSNKRIKRLQKTELVNRNRFAVDLIADKCYCTFDSYDKNSYRYSFKDELCVYRIDVYLSTLTVGIIPLVPEVDPIFLKKQSFNDIEEIMSNPAKFEVISIKRKNNHH